MSGEAMSVASGGQLDEMEDAITFPWLEMLLQGGQGGSGGGAGAGEASWVSKGEWRSE